MGVWSTIGVIQRRRDACCFRYEQVRLFRWDGRELYELGPNGSLNLCREILHDSRTVEYVDEVDFQAFRNERLKNPIPSAKYA
jgi:hypothetical protein